MVLRTADNRIRTKCPVFNDVRAIFIDASTTETECIEQNSLTMSMLN